MKKTTRLIVLNVAFGLVFAACAETYTWTPTGGTSWGTAANWSPNGTPGAADTVVFDANASVVLADSVTVAGIQLANGAKVTLTGAGMWLKSSSFAGTGVLALDGTRITGISTAAATWEVGVVIPSTIGIEIVENAIESRITNEGDKTRLQVNGPLTGTGTVRIGYCDNSAFQGKLIVDNSSSARNRFGAAQSGGEEMTLAFEGNTADNGSVDFADGVLKFGAIKTSSRTTTNYAWRFNNSGTNILEVGHLGKSDDRISIRVGEGSSSSGHLKIRKVGTGTLELWNPGHRYGTEIDNGTILVTSDKALNLYAVTSRPITRPSSRTRSRPWLLILMGRTSHSPPRSHPPTSAASRNTAKGRLRSRRGRRFLHLSQSRTVRSMRRLTRTSLVEST